MKKHITQLILVSIMIFTQSCADYGLGGSTTTDTGNTLTTKPYPPSESSDGNIKLFRTQRFSVQDFRRAF